MSRLSMRPMQVCIMAKEEEHADDMRDLLG